MWHGAKDYTTDNICLRFYMNTYMPPRRCLYTRINIAFPPPPNPELINHGITTLLYVPFLSTKEGNLP